MTTTPQTPATPSPRYCRRCNYNLAALATPRCPECAHPFDPANARTTRPRPARRWLRHLRRAAYLLLTLFLLLAAVWGWFYWGWHDEQQSLTKLQPRSSSSKSILPPLCPHLGSIGFIFDRVDTLVLESHDRHDLSPVRRLLYLRDLSIKFCPVSDLSPLSQLHRLRSLHITSAPVYDLAPLASLKNLESFHLSHPVILVDAWVYPEVDPRSLQPLDLSPLASLTHLRNLGLHPTTIGDLAPLAHLQELEELSLAGNFQFGSHIEDLSPLSGLRSLHTLDLENTSVRDLSPLSALPRLRELNIRNTAVVNIAPLATAPALETLFLDPRGIDLAQFSRLSHLEHLFLEEGTKQDTLEEIQKSLPRCTVEIQYHRQ